MTDQASNRDLDPLARWCERDLRHDNTFALAALYGDGTGFRPASRTDHRARGKTMAPAADPRALLDRAATPAGSTDIDGAGTRAQVRCLLREYEHPPRLIVLGRIDISTADRFAHALEQAVIHAEAREGRLVLDLTEVDFFGAIGTDIVEQHRGAVSAVLVNRSSAAHAALAHSRLRTRLVHRPRRQPGPNRRCGASQDPACHRRARMSHELARGPASRLSV